MKTLADLNNGWIENRHYIGFVWKARELFTAENNKEALSALRLFDNFELVLLNLEYMNVIGYFNQEDEDQLLKLYGRTVK